MKKQISIYRNIIVTNLFVFVFAICISTILLSNYIQSFYYNIYKDDALTRANYVQILMSEQVYPLAAYLEKLKNNLLIDQPTQEEIIDYLPMGNMATLPFVSSIFVWDGQSGYLSNPAYEIDCEMLSSEIDSETTMGSFCGVSSWVFYESIDLTSMEEAYLCVELSLAELNLYLAEINSDPQISFVGIEESGRFVFSDIKLLYPEYRSLLDCVIAMQSNEIDCEVSTSNDRTYVFSSYTVNVLSNSCALVSIIDMSQNAAIPYEDLLLVLFLFSLGVFFLILVATTFGLRHLKRSIQHLQTTITALRNKNFGVQIVSTPPIEFTKVFQLFNEMSFQLDQTIEEKLVSEKVKQEYAYQVLLAQVNPHFLYNALNSINALVDLERYQDIRRLNTALISLLSYSLGKQTELVTIESELKNVEEYLAMQQICHCNRFLLDISVSPEIRKRACTRMILLPLVENSVFHGYDSSKKEKLSISISAECEQGMLVIYVSDTGRGIAPGQLERLLQTNNIEEKAKGRYIRIGLLNVHERIKAEYGEDFGLAVYSTLGEGTVVEIHLPMNL